MECIPDAKTPPGSVAVKPSLKGDAFGLGGGEFPNVLRSDYDHDGIMTSWPWFLLVLESRCHQSATEVPHCDRQPTNSHGF